MDRQEVIDIVLGVLRDHNLIKGDGIPAKKAEEDMDAPFEEEEKNG